MSKTCSHCGETKPVDQFVKKSSGRDGLNARCRTCTRSMVKSHFARNRDYYRRKQAQRRKETRGRLMEIIADNKKKPCVDCGRQFIPCAMDYDHVRGKKLFDVGRVSGTGISEAKLMAEIDKCEVVCAVCHRIRTHERRQKKHTPIAQ